MSNESSFTSLGSEIQRKTLQMTLAVMRAGLGNAHRLSLQASHKALDAYVLERLQAGVSVAEVRQELTRVCGRMADSYKSMVQLIDGQFPITSVGLLQRKYSFTLYEGRLALFLLQLSCRRHLTAEVVQAEVVPTEETESVT
jgi:hypothetical protein